MFLKICMLFVVFFLVFFLKCFFLFHFERKKKQDKKERKKEKQENFWTVSDLLTQTEAVQRNESFFLKRNKIESWKMF